MYPSFHKVGRTDNTRCHSPWSLKLKVTKREDDATLEHIALAIL